MQTAPVVLVCDDDEDDRLLIYEAFVTAWAEAQIRFTRDGVELIEYLQASSPCSLPLRPAIILLDLNMPRMNGLEALKWIKSDPKYQAIPVVIFTTSDEEADIVQCYASGANSFVTKSTTMDGLMGKIRMFSKYWLEIAELQ